MEAETSASDQETRQRLLDAAARLFAERGFKNVTVREICEAAGANVAAVNYYFRDKLGLYREVVQMAADVMESSKREAMDAGEGSPPEERLRTYIRLFLRRLLSEDKEKCWIDGLITWEMADPTPAFELIVKRGILPSGMRLAALVGELMGCAPTDHRVMNCAGSVQAQCLFYRSAKPVMLYMNPGLKFTQEVIDRLADHIAEFSLGGIRTVARQKQEVSQ